jgi:hypothetical protein
MGQMLASDLNNPEFVGAMNPDDLLHVEFYHHEPVDNWQSKVEGKEVKLPRQIFVRIMKPGDNLSILEVPIREDHKKRWPQKWLYFQMKEGMIDDGARIPGWKIEEWPELANNPDALHGLRFLRFYTVEQIAGASDAQVQNIGIGGPSLREKAKLAMRERHSASARGEIERRDQLISDMAAQNAQMVEQMAALQSQMQMLLQDPKKRPGKKLPPAIIPTPEQTEQLKDSLKS